MANQCEYATTLGLVSDAFVFCYISSRRMSWKKWDCYCYFVHLYILACVPLIWHCIIKVLKQTQKKIQAVHLTWTHQVSSGAEISNYLLAKKDKKNNSKTWRGMLLDMLFYICKYWKKNTLWIILEISQNLTKEANGLISKYMLKISCSFGSKHMC